MKALRSSSVIIVISNQVKKSNLKTHQMAVYNDVKYTCDKCDFNPVLVMCIKIGFRTTRYKSVPPYVQRQYCLSEPKKSKIKFQLVS